ncbi:hypothetical protein JW859_10420 [bacterium]|nr:hypothetical protein [bacterium]
MRAILIAMVLACAIASAAFAQGYEYQVSGLEYQPTVPVNVGESVQSLIRLETGLLALGQVYVEDVFYGDMFAYWMGSFNGQTYYYDNYTGYWKPGPVGTTYATLNFKGEVIEGWVRYFGEFTDYDHFFGSDGILYKRINVTRNRTRNTNRRRQIVYTYFVNTQTGERSDGEGLPYRVIGDEDAAVELVEQQMEAREAQLADIVDGDPAYPQWEVTAFEPGEEIVSPTTVPGTGEQTLLDLIETEVGPLTVGEDAAGETAAETSGDSE